jgi:hypothetical protein
MAQRRTRVLLIGEAPGKSGVGVPLQGVVNRWARMLGVEPSSFDEVDRVNLIGAWPGSSGRGSAFPMSEAKAAGALLRMRWQGVGRAVFVGRRVARAMGYAGLPYMEWTEDVEEPSLGTVAVVPHPSGANRWYNDRDDARKAAEFVLGCCSGLTPTSLRTYRYWGVETDAETVRTNGS